MSSVAKVFTILETVVAHQARGLAYSEVVARSQLPKATAHRLLKSLVRAGYLRFDGEVGKYFGDLKLSSLGSAVTSHFELKDYVRPLLLQLQEETRHTCNLAVLSGDAGVYLDKLESLEAYGIKLYSSIGKRFPLHCTGMGKVLLAGMPKAARRKILARKLETFTPNTITDPLALEKELNTVRRCGYALDREEITRGIMCVAAPIRNGEGETVAAISVAFPAYIRGERGVRREIRAVTRCALEATRLLAGKPGGDGALRPRGGRPAPATKKRG
ncbi:MAG TPA: IclR family transcriptional regulator [Candidatus Acidoferrum sp.]|nr:IclR family transcriptional regulator [Candidatus Acidoferrum sp.]